MKRLTICLLLLLSFATFADQSTFGCGHWLSPFKKFCHRLDQIITEGNTDLYFTGYAWHNRFTYDKEKARHFNETAWGGGIGKGFFDEKGNYHQLSIITFLDSHSSFEPTAGYSYLKVANLTQNLKAGLGYSLFLTSRADIIHRIPFPGLLPWASIFYKKITLSATYIPGTTGDQPNGNVLFILAKYTLDA